MNESPHKAEARENRGTQTHRESFQGFCGVEEERKKKGKVLSVWMEMVRVSFFFFSLVAILAIAVLPAINGQISPAPAPASDGLSQKPNPPFLCSSFLAFLKKIVCIKLTKIFVGHLQE